MKESKIIVWTFNFFDIKLKKWCSCNETELWHLERLHSYMKKQPLKYKKISKIYKREVDKC